MTGFSEPSAMRCHGTSASAHASTIVAPIIPTSAIAAMPLTARHRAFPRLRSGGAGAVRLVCDGRAGFIRPLRSRHRPERLPATAPTSRRSAPNNAAAAARVPPNPCFLSASRAGAASDSLLSRAPRRGASSISAILVVCQLHSSAHRLRTWKLSSPPVIQLDATGEVPRLPKKWPQCGALLPHPRRCRFPADVKKPPADAGGFFTCEKRSSRACSTAAVRQLHRDRRCRRGNAPPHRPSTRRRCR
jgi:hypothetical protein